MKTRTVLVVVCLLFAGALVAGCGDDNKSSGDAKPAATAIDAATTESGGTVDPSNPQVQQAVDACKQHVAANPSVSDSVKADLDKICEKAASGDEKAVREATRDVCRKVVEETAPEGPARDQALTACDQATAGD
jgi:hypothetical protein